MKLVLQLPIGLEYDLTAEAGELGVPLEEHAIRILNSHRNASTVPQNGKELVEYWQREGLVGMRADISDSGAHARQLRAQAENRRP